MKVKERLIEAEAKALELFRAIEEHGLLTPGKSEKQLNTEVFELAKKLFGIEKYWHKRLVRTGPNTLYAYKENPPDLLIAEDDILFLDFGPIFEEWEADFGRTYVIGNDPLKHKLKKDIEDAWEVARQWFGQHTSLTGAAFYEYVVQLTSTYGWTFGGEIAGHIIGQFPHEKLAPGTQTLYVHPDNHEDMFLPDKDGQPREWILEMHFVDREKQIGGFFEQLLTR